MFQQVLTIARNTFVESVRQPIFVALVLVGELALVLIPSLAAYTLEDDNKMLIDMGLSTLLIIGLLLAAFTATKVLTAELENKTVLTVVSKPVSRPVFVLGKYLGVAGAQVLAMWILTMVFLLAVRHQVMETAGDYVDWPVVLFGVLAALLALGGAALANYFYNWVFTSSYIFSHAVLITLAYALVLLIGKGWVFQPIATEFTKNHGQLVQLLLALVLVFEAALVLTAVAVAVSTRLGQVMTLLISVGVFLLSLISDSFYNRFAADVGWDSVHGFWPTVAWVLSTVVYRLTPNLQFLWLADDLTQGNPITGGYILWVSGYALLFVVGILALAIALFQTREIG